VSGYSLEFALSVKLSALDVAESSPDEKSVTRRA